MVKLEKAVIARHVRDGEHFEVLVDPELALDLKHGKQVNFDELLAADTVFKDAKKGEAKSDESIKKAFGTADIKDVAKRIISDGEVQLTTEQRRQMIERRRKELVAFIAKNAYNPQTNTPHPEARIQRAMEEANVHIGLQKPLTEQAQTVIGEIKKLIPLSMESFRVAVKVPSEYAGKASAVIHKYNVQQESWQSNGSVVAVLELPAGLKGELFNELNSLTHGAVETKLLVSGQDGD